jgi:hypothetical protein
MQTKFYFTILFVFLFLQSFSISVKSYSVQVSVEVDEETPALRFSWPMDENADFYYIFKKTKEDVFWTDTLAILPGTATGFDDTDIQDGEAFEYGFYKSLISSHDTVIVNQGANLSFHITDSWGDGVCCHHGIGSYTIKGKNITYLTGGEFGTEETKNFTVDAGADSQTDEIVITINQDVFPIETQWQLSNVETNQIIASGGPYVPHMYGHIYAGINVPEKEEMGTVLLVIDDFYGEELDYEINRLKLDLIGEGWQVKNILVNRNDEVTKVKEMILTEYEKDISINSILLLGHVPVPYSGNLGSGHPDHTGAYPADVYYAEFDDEWTDFSVTNITASREANHNVPGDGKFDRTFIDSDVDVSLGRVDVSNYEVFPKTEIKLMRNYLNKNHVFRAGEVDIERRGLIDDNVGELGGMAPAANGYRNFAAMFGAENITNDDYFTTLSAHSYLWAYGCGGGSYISCQGIGTTTNFATKYVQSVFNMLYGSYFGDWDNTNNILRASLAADGNCLTNVWGGAPNWHFHHMALGETIGYSTLVTQNNISVYAPTDKARQIHIALMGDPTLKMHIVKPARNTTLQQIENTIKVSWEEPADNIIGYHIYRSDSIKNKFVRINDHALSRLSFTDNNPFSGNNIYMIRALKLEKSGSGTYYNLSCGVIDSLKYTGTIGIDAIEKEIKTEYNPNPFNDKIRFSFNSKDILGNLIINIYDITMQKVSQLYVESDANNQYYFEWDATNFNNMKVNSGLYIVQIMNREQIIECLKIMKI